MTAPPTVDVWLSAALSSHERLAGIVRPLTPEQLDSPSYASEWSIAQVLSHLGSGAEIFSLFLKAGTDGSPVPGMAEFGPIWEAWNARSPADQAADALAADRLFLDAVVALDQPARAAWHMDLFGADRGLSDVLRLRLGEHAVHTWDIQVTQEPAAALPPDATALIIDNLGELIGRVDRTGGAPVHVLITTTGPSRRLLLTGEKGAPLALREADEAETADQAVDLDLPAEALVRLVYGRLDPAHTPAVGGDGDLLDSLRRMFPGF
jgi:uncharacterized protein (TIGR03083 family)